MEFMSSEKGKKLSLKIDLNFASTKCCGMMYNVGSVNSIHLSVF